MNIKLELFGYGLTLRFTIEPTPVVVPSAVPTEPVPTEPVPTEPVATEPVAAAEDRKLDAGGYTGQFELSGQEQNDFGFNPTLSSRSQERVTAVDPRQ